MANKSKILKDNEKEIKEKFERKICANMGNGFEWLSANWSILKLTQAINDGKLVDPDYQRGKVWDDVKNKALIETILRYGGNKIPTLTLRNIGEDTFEMVDGKQRVWSSIKPFVEGEFKLNGVYVPELRSFSIKEIKKEYPQIYSAFMNTTIPVQIAYNMTDEEAKTYFIQINESGVTMRIGEKIHANQGTPLIKVIDDLKEHKVWNCVGHISRHNDYAYISRMLLYIRDYSENKKVLKVYTNSQLMMELNQYLSFNVPESIIDELCNDLNILHTTISKNKCKVRITDVFSLFLYVHAHQKDKDFYPVKFGEFVCGFNDNLPYNRGVFRLFNQKKERWASNPVKYYEWYIKTIDILYHAFLKGADWDEISKLQVKS